MSKQNTLELENQFQGHSILDQKKICSNEDFETNNQLEEPDAAQNEKGGPQMPRTFALDYRDNMRLKGLYQESRSSHQNMSSLHSNDSHSNPH